MDIKKEDLQETRCENGEASSQCTDWVLPDHRDPVEHTLLGNAINNTSEHGTYEYKYEICEDNPYKKNPVVLCGTCVVLCGTCVVPLLYK